MFLPWQYREDDAWTLDSKTQTQAQITLSEEKNEINADKTDTMNIDRGGHTYTCYVSAILAYIPFGCLHYRSHYFVPNLYWTNLQSEQQQKKTKINQTFGFGRPKDTLWIRCIDWFNSTLNCPRIVSALLLIFGHTFFFLAPYSSVVTIMFKCFFRAVEQMHWTEQRNCVEQTQPKNHKYTKLIPRSVFNEMLTITEVGRLSKVCAAKKTN